MQPQLQQQKVTTIQQQKVATIQQQPTVQQKVFPVTVQSSTIPSVQVIKQDPVVPVVTTVPQVSRIWEYHVATVAHFLCQIIVPKEFETHWFGYHVIPANCPYFYPQFFFLPCIPIFANFAIFVSSNMYRKFRHVPISKNIPSICPYL